MNILLDRLYRLLFELKRRKTMRVTIGYALVLAALIGPASDILGGIDAPDWILRTLIIVLLGAFPFVLICSWVFDLTPHGFEKTPDLSWNSEDKTRTVEASETPEVIRTVDSKGRTCSFPLQSVEEVRGTILLVHTAGKDEDYFLIQLQDAPHSNAEQPDVATASAKEELPELQLVGKS